MSTRDASYRLDLSCCRAHQPTAGRTQHSYTVRGAGQPLTYFTSCPTSHSLLWAKSTVRYTGQKFRASFRPKRQKSSLFWALRKILLTLTQRLIWPVKMTRLLKKPKLRKKLVGLALRLEAATIYLLLPLKPKIRRISAAKSKTSSKQSAKILASTCKKSVHITSIVAICAAQESCYATVSFSRLWPRMSIAKIKVQIRT